MKTVIVSSDIQGINFPTGGIAAFVTHFSELLRAGRYEVTVLSARGEMTPIDPMWAATYQTRGIDVVQVAEQPSPVHTWGDSWSVRRSEEIAKYVKNADVVYFQEWHANGLQTVRQKRFSGKSRPVCVTVLHGCSERSEEHTSELQSQSNLA